MPFRVERWFDGCTVAVIGSGPSLTAYQLHLVGQARLEGRCRVIACNEAIYVAWWADWLHAADHKWWHWSWHRVQHFKGRKTGLSDALPSAWGVGFLKLTGVDGFDPDPSCVRSGQTSGYQAVHSAIHAGAKRILLLGIDMKGNGEHFHRPHPDKSGPGWLTSAAKFDGLVQPAADRGVEILNCSPGSAVTAFKRCDDLAWGLGLAR
jgi:hypothetical protein